MIGSTIIPTVMALIMVLFVDPLPVPGWAAVHKDSSDQPSQVLRDHPVLIIDISGILSVGSSHAKGLREAFFPDMELISVGFRGTAEKLFGRDESPYQIIIPAGEGLYQVDDFVKTLRAAYLYGLTFVGVSIEPREGDTEVQDVVFYAGTENSRAGEILFACDFLLKKIGLEFQSSRVAGKQTYLQFAIEDARQSYGDRIRICSRFCFYPTAVQCEIYDDAVILRSMGIEVLTQTLSAEVNGEKKLIVVRKEDRTYLLVFQSEVCDFGDTDRKCFQRVIESFDWSR